MRRSSSYYPSYNAFSLVELSIVLVILGLLVGGILAGQSLIRASEIRSVGADLAKYQTAIAAFRDKYFALPGDMTNATSFWGTASNCSNSQGTSGTLTCNGDGDGILVWATAQRGEVFLFWQHLSNAGLVENSFNGARGPGGWGASSVAGVNVPALKIGGSCASVFAFSQTTAFNLTPLTTGNAFSTGFAPTSGSNIDYCYGAYLTTDEAWNLDTKMDDGRPGTGQMLSWNSGRSASCATSDTADIALYNLGASNKRCAPVMRFQTP